MLQSLKRWNSTFYIRIFDYRIHVGIPSLHHDVRANHLLSKAIEVEMSHSESSHKDLPKRNHLMGYALLYTLMLYTVCTTVKTTCMIPKITPKEPNTSTALNVWYALISVLLVHKPFSVLGLCF